LITGKPQRREVMRVPHPCREREIVEAGEAQDAVS
jgi:hypothetical protein